MQQHFTQGHPFADSTKNLQRVLSLAALQTLPEQRVGLDHTVKVAWKDLDSSSASTISANEGAFERRASAEQKWI